jgi:hypothetical protein
MDVSQIGREKKVALGFGRRAPGDFEESQRLLRRVLTTSFGDVRCDRECGSTKLTRNDPSIGARERSREPIDREEELARALPDLQAPEVMHGGKLPLLAAIAASFERSQEPLAAWLRPPSPSG